MKQRAYFFGVLGLLGLCGGAVALGDLDPNVNLDSARRYGPTCCATWMSSGCTPRASQRTRKWSWEIRLPARSGAGCVRTRYGTVRGFSFRRGREDEVPRVPCEARFNKIIVTARNPPNQLDRALWVLVEARPLGLLEGRARPQRAKLREVQKSTHRIFRAEGRPMKESLGLHKCHGVVGYASSHTPADWDSRS
jgi:hypothetical protein